MAQTGYLGQLKFTLGVILAAMIVVGFVDAQEIGVNLGEPVQFGNTVGVVTGDILISNVNSSQFWDNLDTPADIFLNSLGDTEVPGPTNGQILTFNTGTSRWIAADNTGPTANTTQNLTNVAFVNQTNDFTMPQMISSHLNVSGNFTGNELFGELFFPLNEAGLDQVFTAVDVYQNISFFPNAMQSGEMNGVSAVNDVLEIEVSGKYAVNYEIVFTGKSSTDFFTAIRINDDIENKSVGIKGVKNDDEIYTITGTDIISVVDGDVVQLCIRQRGGSPAIYSIFTADLNIRRVGDL